MRSHRDLIDTLDIEFIVRPNSLNPDRAWEVGKYNSFFYAYGRSVKEALENYRAKFPHLVLDPAKSE